MKEVGENSEMLSRQFMEFCVHFGCDSMEKEEKTNDPLGEV